MTDRDDGAKEQVAVNTLNGKKDRRDYIRTYPRINNIPRMRYHV